MLRSWMAESRIPLEIYPLILEYIDDMTTLLSMLVTSKIIFPDVERKLYHSVDFVHEDDHKHIRFLRSFHNTNRPYLPSLVRRYCYADKKNPSPELFDLIRRTLVTFINLRELRFLVADEDTFSDVFPQECPPFNLEIFQWSSDRRAGHNVKVLHFLTTQHSLKTLVLYRSGTEMAQVPLKNLLNLDSVAGSIAAFLPLLPPTIPIKRMHWMCGFNQGISCFESLTNLRVLSFSSGASRPLLSDIANRLGILEVLGLYSIHNDELPDLYRLPLRTLVIDRIGGEDPSSFTNQIFRNMSPLQHIFVLADNTHHPKQYLLWGREVPIPSLVSAEELEINWWGYFKEQRSNNRTARQIQKRGKTSWRN